MTPMQARAATIATATLAIIVMALSTSADAETCTFEDTATKEQFQAECDTDATKLPPAQWSQHCKLPQRQMLSLSQLPPSAARPCKDDNDTNCYSLITLECR